MQDNLIQITDDQFKQTIDTAGKPVLVDFWAPWCGPCRAVSPILEELAGEYDGKVLIAKVNTDQNQLTPMAYGVRGIPTMVLFRDGQEIDRYVGALPKDALRKWLDSAIDDQAIAN
jgi:thioredoxin 1